jgi:hypothetical protein
LCVSSALHLSREGFGVELSNYLLALCATGTSITHVGVQLMLDNVRSLRVCDLATVQNITKIYKKKSGITIETCPKILRYILKSLVTYPTFLKISCLLCICAPPAEKELQYFAENCSILQKNVVILHLL